MDGEFSSPEQRISEFCPRPAPPAWTQAAPSPEGAAGDVFALPPAKRPALGTAAPANAFPDAASPVPSFLLPSF